MASHPQLAALGMASLALGCVSTGEPLFREAGLNQQPSFESPMTEVMPASSAPLESATTPATVVGGPEQLIGADRDEASSDPVASGNGTSNPQSTDAGGVPPEQVPPTVATEPCALDDAIVCATFDELPDGVFPEGDGWLPELAACGSHTIDGAGPSFSGTKALRADDGGYPECMLHTEVSAEDEVYVRTRGYFGAGELLSQYVSVLEFGGRAAQDDPELRVGVRPTRDGVCPTAGVDVTGSGISGGRSTECTGFELAPERWYCIEAHLVRSGTNLSLSLSIDGAALVARDFVGNNSWDLPGLFVKLGRAAYGASGRGSLWHDDVAVGRQPIPCGAPAPLP